jgi:RNA polymerase sigma factor (sigma-70 family)
MTMGVNFSYIASLYDEYLNSMYSYAIHMGFNEQTVMDAIHDVFYKLCINQSVLNNISNHKSYLLRALRNRLIDINRSDRIQTVENTKKEEDAEKLTFMLNVTVEDELIEKEAQDEIRHKVEEYLKKLSDRQREIIYLRFIEEHSYEEIAEIMNISVESSRNLISKSLSKLKNQNLLTYIY